MVKELLEQMPRWVWEALALLMATGRCITVNPSQMVRVECVCLSPLHRQVNRHRSLRASHCLGLRGSQRDSHRCNLHCSHWDVQQVSHRANQVSSPANSLQRVLPRSHRDSQRQDLLYSLPQDQPCARPCNHHRSRLRNRFCIQQDSHQDSRVLNPAVSPTASLAVAPMASLPRNLREDRAGNRQLNRAPNQVSNRAAVLLCSHRRVQVHSLLCHRPCNQVRSRADSRRICQVCSLPVIPAGSLRGRRVRNLPGNRQCSLPGLQVVSQRQGQAHSQADSHQDNQVRVPRINPQDILRCSRFRSLPHNLRRNQVDSLL